jgi:hypothetical protein
MSEENYFQKLNSIDVSSKVEKKNGLSYLSWAWAWGELKKIYPNANYHVYETTEGRIYWDDGKTAWVKVSVTVEGIEHIEYLPVMDYKNQSIPKDKITSFDVNKSIQRALTKAVARHGLGLFIYAGEDLPEGANTPSEQQNAPTASKNGKAGELQGQIKDIVSKLNPADTVKFMDWLKNHGVDSISGITDEKSLTALLANLKMVFDKEEQEAKKASESQEPIDDDKLPF